MALRGMFVLLMVQAMQAQLLTTASGAAPRGIGQYLFIPLPDHSANIEWASIIHVGIIDARGGFHVKEKIPAIDAIRQPRNMVGGFTSFSKATEVYEFRSGRLILGTMMPDGEFVPKVGSTVIKYEDYRHG